MKIGVVGLGRMGEAIAYRLYKAGYAVIAYDMSIDARNMVASYGVAVVDTIEALAQQVNIVWVMVPSGSVTTHVIQTLCALLPEHSILIDGGNSCFKDSIRHAQDALKKNISFLDCGTSGGVHGKEVGFCLMVGGDRAAYDKVYHFLQAIAAPKGCAYIGRSGTGHYVKMVHNGIEYALMQAYAEGFHVIKEGTFKQDNLNLADIADVWRHGSVIRSFLLDLSYAIFEKDQLLNSISGEVAQTGMGLWTQQEAEQNNIAVPVISESLRVRNWSCKTGGNYGTKIVALLRNQFGGHTFKKNME